MSFKLNLREPGRKFMLQLRRVRQRSRVATKPFRSKNKYIISGPLANVKPHQTADIIWG